MRHSCSVIVRHEYLLTTDVCVQNCYGWIVDFEIVRSVEPLVLGLFNDQTLVYHQSTHNRAPTLNGAHCADCDTWGMIRSKNIEETKTKAGSYFAHAAVDRGFKYIYLRSRATNVSTSRCFNRTRMRFARTSTCGKTLTRKIRLLLSYQNIP